MSSEESKRLTPNDPIDVETLARISELESTRARLGLQLLDIEDDKVKILVSSRRIDEEKQRIFEKALMERGLPPNTPVEINANTGLIHVLGTKGSADVPPNPAAKSAA